MWLSVSPYIAVLTKLRVVNIGPFNPAHFRRVFIVAAVFQAGAYTRPLISST